MRRPPIYGLLAEFDTPTELVTAARKARAEGYRVMDAYSPFPIEELAEALHFHDRRLPLVVLLGGLFGGVAGYALEYWTSVIDYPLNVGGRPLHSWPAFVPPTFEMTVLIASLTAVSPPGGAPVGLTTYSTCPQGLKRTGWPVRASTCRNL